MNKRRLGTERGFALPLTVLVVTVMTILISSAYVRVRADRVIAESSGSTVDALAVAQSGLQRYFIHYDTLTPKVRPPDGDSVRINVPHGYADVLAHKVFSPSDMMQPETYVVRSTGHLIEPVRGSQPQAQRTVAQFAQWQSAAMKVLGTITTPNGLQVAPGALDLRVMGVDQCPGPAPVPTTAGIRTTAGNAPNPADFSVLNGTPWIDAVGSAAAVADSTGIDWPGILGGQFEAEYSSFQPFDTSYPTMLINGNLSLFDTGGYGLLIVTGDLTTAGNLFQWQGVILVGGAFRANSQFTYTSGLIVTGLNIQVGGSPGLTQIGAGTNHYFRYFECEVRWALDPLTGFVPIRNTWIDNWATY